jgi:predicted dehydrogenase
MNALVIGLGSMGKRRIRCLKALAINEIYGYDTRQDRLNEAVSKYGIIEVKSLSEIYNKTDLLIISTPPDTHLDYIKQAIAFNKPCFVEAGVLLEEVKEAKELNASDVFIAPSCTLKFHPVIKKIKEITQSGQLGKLTNFSYHSGQFLPDWHPWENVNEFYVSKKETGGCREIVPFELTWLTDCFGMPSAVKGYFGKTMDIGCNVDDTYAFLLKGDTYFGMVTVDVVSRTAVRQLLVNYEKGQLTWNWNDSFLNIYEVSTNAWTKFEQPAGQSEDGYNKNIIEEMYIEEIRAFVKGIKDPACYPNTVENDIKILDLLNKIEQNDGGFLK